MHRFAYCPVTNGQRSGRGVQAHWENEWSIRRRSFNVRLSQLAARHRPGTAYNYKDSPLPYTAISDENRHSVIWPEAASFGTLTEPRQFNLMLTTEIGAVDPVKAYLRPETAQGIFLEFKNIVDTSRRQDSLRRRPGRQELPQ